MIEKIENRLGDKLKGLMKPTKPDKQDTILDFSKIGGPDTFPDHRNLNGTEVKSHPTAGFSEGDDSKPLKKKKSDQIPEPNKYSDLSDEKDEAKQRIQKKSTAL